MKAQKRRKRNGRRYVSTSVSLPPELLQRVDAKLSNGSYRIKSFSQYIQILIDADTRNDSAPANQEAKDCAVEGSNLTPLPCQGQALASIDYMPNASEGIGSEQTNGTWKPHVVDSCLHALPVVPLLPRIELPLAA